MLYSAQTNTDLIECCNDFFFKKVRSSAPIRESDALFMKMYSGAAQIDDLVVLKNQWNYSSRYLEKKFIELTGVRAGELFCKKKALAALGSLVRSDYTSLTSVAYDHGYYDQSHFIKSFRSYFGITPLQFKKRRHLLLQYFV